MTLTAKLGRVNRQLANHKSCILVAHFIAVRFQRHPSNPQSSSDHALLLCGLSRPRGPQHGDGRDDGLLPGRADATHARRRGRAAAPDGRAGGAGPRLGTHDRPPPRRAGRPAGGGGAGRATRTSSDAGAARRSASTACCSRTASPCSAASPPWRAKPPSTPCRTSSSPAPGCPPSIRPRALLRPKLHV